MTLLSFQKMHCGGNDYLFFDGLGTPLPDLRISALAKELSRHHFSVGGDGLVLLLPPTSPDCHAAMRMFNADGSEGNTCGTALRCLGKLLFEKEIFEVDPLHPEDGGLIRIETAAGIQVLRLHRRGNRLLALTVEFGQPVFSPQFPLGLPFVFEGSRCLLFCLSVGNPHAVLFSDDAKRLSFTAIRDLVSRLHPFPDGFNLTLAALPKDGCIEAAVDERGSGQTLSCGSGAVATAAAAVRGGLWPKETPLALRQPGGCVSVTVREDGAVLLRGTAFHAFCGEILLQNRFLR